MVLSEAIKTIKNLNSTTTDKSGQLQELIQGLITFLVAWAVDSLRDKDDNNKMIPTTFDKANESEMHKFKKSISKLIPDQNNTNNKNNKSNDDKLSKKRKIIQTKDYTEQDDSDNKDERQGGQKRSLLVTSLQDEKDLAILGIIQQIQNNMAINSNKTVTKSRYQDIQVYPLSTTIKRLPRTPNEAPNKNPRHPSSSNWRRSCRSFQRPDASI